MSQFSKFTPIRWFRPIRRFFGDLEFDPGNPPLRHISVDEFMQYINLLAGADTGWRKFIRGRYKV